MWTRLGDVDSVFPMLAELRRRMDTVLEEQQGPGGVGSQPGWPRVTALDEGTQVSFRAELPGLSEKDVEITLNQDVLTLSGLRKVEAPAGYTLHRQERRTAQFSRSYALPFKVDAEKVGATMKDGVLTVALRKAPEATPRQITVKAG